MSYSMSPVTMHHSSSPGSVSQVQLKGVDLNLGADAIELVGVEQYNACGRNPCVNGGTCVPANVKYGFSCLCPQGFIGARCEEVVQQCYPSKYCFYNAGFLL